MDHKTIIDSCVMQEERFQFFSFSREDALKLGLMMCETAKRYKQGVAMVIEVNGLRVFQHVTEGAGRHNVEWAGRKINTVNQFGKASLRVWAEFEHNGQTMEEERLDPMKFAMCGGGFPLIVRGVGQVGVIAVSGLPHLDDHQVIVDALTEWFSAKKR
ncbi:MAG: heme-degrading domain-containing protein [Butyricicoccus sp.]